MWIDELSVDWTIQFKIWLGRIFPGQQWHERNEGRREARHNPLGKSAGQMVSPATGRVLVIMIYVAVHLAYHLYPSSYCTKNLVHMTFDLFSG